MLKILLCFFTLKLSLFAFGLKFEPIKTELIKLDEPYAYIKDSPDIKLYSSAVVVQHFKDSQSIIARASVVAKENGLAKLKLSAFSTLKQRALPSLDTSPKVGDEVILNFLYHRALIIAPSKQTYEQIFNDFPQLYFSPIDIFAAQLVRTRIAAPRHLDFKRFCSDNALGLLFIALEDEVQILDCQDFTKLDQKPISKSLSVQVPFYSRISRYRTDFFGFEKVENYYEYYNALIHTPSK